MHAVLEIDLKARILARLGHHLIDPGRAIALRRFGETRQIDRNRDGRVYQPQMRGLVFVMVGGGKGDIGQPVEGQDAIGFGIVDRGEIHGKAGGLGIGLAVTERAEGGQADGVQPHVDAATDQRGDQPVIRPQGFDIAHLLQVLANGPAAHFRLIGRQFIAAPPRPDGGMGGLGGGDA